VDTVDLVPLQRRDRHRLRLDLVLTRFAQLWNRVHRMRITLTMCATAIVASLAIPATAADQEPVVKAIEFIGISFGSESELRGVMLTVEPGWKFWRADPVFDEDSLREDLDRIDGYYRERGYYEAQAQYELDWKGGPRAVCVAIKIDEGEPARLSDWKTDVPEVSWLDDAARAELLEGLPLEVGSPFGAVQYRAARDALLTRLANLGHPAARLDGGLDVDLATHSAHLRWSLEPGPEVRFGAVRVTGLADVEEDLVRRELTFEEGELFSLAALNASQRRVYDLQLFRAVTLTDERPASDVTDPEASIVWPVVVRVEERAPRTIRISAGYGTEDEFRGQISWVHRNFFGNARSVTVSAKYSSLIAGIEGQLTQPRFLDPKVRLEADASFYRETVPAFDALVASAGVTLSRPLFGKWRGRVGHRFEWSDVSDFKADDSVGDESARTSTLLFGLGRSSVDDALNPRTGTWFDLSVEPTLKALGSAADFVKLSMEARAYAPIYRATLAGRLRAGTIQPFAASGRDDVPTVTRFYAGGSGSVRGFEFQRLPPLDNDEDPLGGLSLVEATIEVRFPIWRRLKGNIFFDAGQLSARPFGFSFDNLYYSVGPGLRVKTPIGSIGLDYGYLLRRPSGLDRGRIHFSVGATF
jgi:outer membrane protein assembly complex protein YaeT